MEQTQEQTTTSTPPKRQAARLHLVLADGSESKIVKYPMPLKAPRFDLIVNGEACEAAQTTFGAIKYTYFNYKGVDFQAEGHIDADSEVQFVYPETYTFKQTGTDRKKMADNAAKALAAKKAATAADAPAPSADEAPAVDAPAEAPKKGKKSKK